MKLSNKIALISSVGCLALIGTGFAAWTFTNTKDANAGFEAAVTAAIEAKELKVTTDGTTVIDKLYLICDAPSNGTNLVAGNGIYWSTAKENDVSKKVTKLILVGSVNENDYDIPEITKYTGTFTSAAFTAVDGTYVDIAGVAALNEDVESTGKNADVTYEYTLPVPSYGTVPANVEQVGALQTEVTDLALTFTFQFAVKSVA